MNINFEKPSDQKFIFRRTKKKKGWNFINNINILKIIFSIIIK